MEHFEDFWNSAENIGAQLPDSSAEDIIAHIKTNLDKFMGVSKLERENAILMGDIIFDICKLTLKFNINSAAALNFANEVYKAQIHDPENNP